MLTKEQAFKRIFEIASTDFTHQDYKRTIDLRRLYKAFVTGEDADYLLRQFDQRENKEQFAQRCLLTQLITPAICNILTTPAQKIPSVKPLVKEFGYTTQNTKDELILKEAINNFWGDQSVDEYLRVNFITLSDIDPNAFMIVKFNAFDGRFEKPEVYATTVSCESVVDFEYANNILQYLAIRKTIKYFEFAENSNKKPKEKDGYFYQMYVDDWEIELTQVDVKMFKGSKEFFKDKFTFFELDVGGSAINIQYYDEKLLFNIGENTNYYTLGNNGKLFQVNFYNTKAGRVPAIRTGANLDPYTNNRTCVNQFHVSVPYLMKSVKTVSELDLSQSLHVFLQKFTYAPKCLGYTNAQNQTIDCRNGYSAGGDVCQSCKGAGVMIHTSGQDHIQLGLPNDPNQIFDLSKLVHYADIPIDIVKWLDEYLDGLVTKAVNARFSSTMFVEQSIAKTATEKTYEMETVYDALAPQASQYSRAWMMIVRMIAVYKDINKDLYINHLFPQDWKMESTNQRMKRLKEATEAGANQYTLQSLQADLMDAVYADQPQKLREFNTMLYFNPFANTPESEVKFKISSGRVLEYDQVLYDNLKRIMLEAYDTNINFYSMTRKAQTEIVSTIVNRIISELKAQSLEKQATLLTPFSAELTTE